MPVFSRLYLRMAQLLCLGYGLSLSVALPAAQRKNI